MSIDFDAIFQSGDFTPLLGATIDDAFQEGFEAAQVRHQQKRAGQIEQAQAEIAKGWPAKDAKIAELEARFQQYCKAAGISTWEEFDQVPDSKAIKGYEEQIARMEREIEQANTRSRDLEARMNVSARDKQIAQAISRFPFVDAGDVKVLVNARTVEEDGDLLFDLGGGRLAPLNDGIEWLARSKPHLVRVVH